MMKLQQFEIWLADLNPRLGTEAGKTRPVLIVQNNILNGVHPSTLICPITTQVRPGIKILRVAIPQGIGGLNKTSAIMIDQLRAIDNKRLLKKIGELPIVLSATVGENLKIVLDI
jgi:mRNA interferase MazF